MDDFNQKYDDLSKRGYDISFYEKNNFSLFTKKEEKTYYVLLKKDGKELFRFPSRISSREALRTLYNLLPKIENLFSQD